MASHTGHTDPHMFMSKECLCVDFLMKGFLSPLTGLTVWEMVVFSSLSRDFDGMSEFDPLTSIKKNVVIFKYQQGFIFLKFFFFTSQHYLLGENNQDWFLYFKISSVFFLFYQLKNYSGSLCYTSLHSCFRIWINGKKWGRLGLECFF